MNVPGVAVDTGTVTEFPTVVVTVAGLPLSVYEKVNGATPPVAVNVILGAGAAWHTAIVPAMVAAGN